MSWNQSVMDDSGTRYGIEEDHRELHFELCRKPDGTCRSSRVGDSTGFHAGIRMNDGPDTLPEPPHQPALKILVLVSHQVRRLLPVQQC